MYHLDRVKSTPHFPKNNADGMALALTLALTAAVVLCVVEMQLAAKLALRLERNRLERTAMALCAADAVWEAVGTLARDREPYWDHTNKPWAKPLARVLPDGARISAEITDENRYYNVNNLACESLPAGAAAPEAIIARALGAAGFADTERIAAALAGAVRRRGIENGCAAFDNLGELDSATGIDGLAASASGFLTVLPLENMAPSRLNINTADRSALRAALGPEHAPLADWICTMRDSEPFASLDKMAAILPAETFRNFHACFEARSVYFSIRAQASNENGVSSGVYALVKRLDNGGAQVLRWVAGR